MKSKTIADRVRGAAQGVCWPPQLSPCLGGRSRSPRRPYGGRSLVRGRARARARRDLGCLRNRVTVASQPARPAPQSAGPLLVEAAQV